MADIEGVNIPTRTTYDPSGLEKAQKDLGKTGEAAKDAGTAATAASAGWEKLTGAIAGLVTAGAAIEFLRSAWEGAYEDEKAARGLATAAQAYGHDVGLARQRAKEFTEALSAQAGIADSTLMGALSRAYLATGNLEQSELRVKLAADISTKSHKSFEEAMTLVARTAEGAGERLLKLEGIHAKGTTVAERAQDALDQLAKRYGSVSKAADDNALAIDRSRAKWDNFKDSVGAQLLPVTLKAKEAMMYLYDAIILLTSKGLNELLGFGKALGAWASALPTLVTKGFGAAWAQLKAETDRIREETAATNRQLDEDTGERILKRNANEFAALTALNGKKLKAGKDLANEEMATAKEFHDYTMEDLRARVAAEESSLKKLGLEYELYAKERQQAAKAVVADGRDVQNQLSKVLDIELQKRLQAEKKYRADVEKILQGMTDDVNKEVDARLAYERKAFDAEERMRRHAAETAHQYTKQKLSDQDAFAKDTVGALATVFGFEKEVHAAEGLMGASLTFIRTLSVIGATPWGIAAAAAGLALALAQVAKIVATDIKTGTGGFDVAANDQASYLGGRKWAQDQVKHFSSGASAVMAGYHGGMTSNSSADNRRTYNVHLHGVGLFNPSNRAMVSELMRTMQSIDRNVEQRVVTGRG
jgi:hypothetical protein